MRIVTSITSALSGVTFNLGVVLPGESYGVGGALINRGTGVGAAIVEFYDARGMPGAELDPGRTGRFGRHGHFIARFALLVLTAKPVREPFALQPHDTDWRVDAESLNDGLQVVRAFVVEKIGGR